MKTNSFLKKLKDHATMFLVRQVNPPPLMLVSIYTYLRLQIQLPDYMAYTFFTVGVIFAVVFSYNHFFFYSPILNNGIGYWSILNLFLGLLGSNQKWKLYLYLFIIGDAITIPYPSVSKIYLICCTLYLWLNIYRNLIFKTLDDNLIFFMGFFTIFVFELCSKIIQEIDGYWQIAFFTVPFSVLIAYKLLTTKIQKLKKKNILKSRDVEQINHYISLIKQQIKSPYTREGYIQKHKQNCYSVECFCRNPHLTEGQLLGNINFKTKIQYYFIRNLYETALQLKGIPKKQFLQNKFIQFLIQNNQITQAIQLYTKLQCLSAKFYYFRWVQRTRLFYKIQQKLLQMDYFNIFNDQFIYAFKYDNSYLYLASQIKEILKRKIIFWNQVGKQNPYMIKLQKYGSQIVEKMYNLNNFYYQEIKEQEEKINNFNGTIIYAMYLLSTTNYKQYAESLIKNTSRTLQSIKIHEDNIAETFGLRVIIRDCNQSCNQKIQVLDAIVQAQQLQKFLNADNALSSVLTLQKQHINKAKRLKQFYQGGFVQIISNVSGSLCKLLKTSKNNLLGTDLNKIIPASYQQKHHLKLQKLLHVQKRRNNKQLINLSFINRLRHVPLKTFDNKLISTKINVKIFQGIDDNLSFIALIQTINQNKVTLITDLNGNIQEYEEGLNNFKILECEEVSNVFAQLRTQWENNQQISTKKINVTYHENNYSICFSSPYQTSFIQDTKLQKNPEFQDQSQKLFEKQVQNNKKQVPIHIDITNESIPYLMNGKQDREQQMTKCIKKMESVFYKTDIDSQSSTNSSRKSSVVNVLMTFSENYFIPFYGYIIGVFALILIGSIVANSIGYSQLGLAWDNTIQQKNPIVNIISVMYMRSIMLGTVSHQLDLLQYQNNPLLNKSNINNFYGLNKTQYPTYVRQWTQRKQIKFKESASSTSMYISDVLVNQIQRIWQTLIPTVNPNNPSPDKNTQLLPIQNIFMNYIVDMDLLSLGRPYSSTIISFNFYSTIEYILSQISPLFDVLNLSIQKSIAINIVFCSILAVIICLSIIPLYILLKKRIKRHIDIYDLIVSVQGQLIKQQVKKLENIVTIVNNSNESSQVLKSNTINYLARKRSSVNQSNGGSNQMIEGLIDQKNNDSVVEQQDGGNYTLKLETKQSNFLAKSSSNQLLHKQYDTLHQKDADLYEKKLKTPTRIRSGQLDLKGSEGDSKKVVCKHFILYFLIIVSCFGLVSITISKIGYFSNVKSVIKQITSYNNNIIQQKLLLLNAKMFFRGMNNVNFTYHNMNYLQWLQKKVYLNFALNFNSKYRQQQPLPPCWNTKYSNNFLFCKQTYSILTLRQQIDQYIKQSYQKRLNLNTQFNISATNMTLLPADQLKQMSEHFFYVQSMMDHVANYTQNNINNQIQKMLDDQVRLNNELKTIYIIGVIWGIICLIAGVILINYMKKLYFNEIIIVSFLNTQMISKNKRVQSFLQTLSKSSY